MNIDISGNLRGPTVIFLAGWPDSSDVFRTNLMAQLARDYRIVGITMPGYADASPFMRAYRDGFREARNAADQLSRMRRETEKERRLAKRRSSWAPQVRDAFALTQRWCTLQRKQKSAPSSADGEERDDGRQAEQDAGLDLVRYQLENDDEPMRTPLFGHGFQDLVRLLEIAVDSAMEMHNECPFAFLATSIVDGNNSVQGVPAHQLPPYYPRPVMVAHGWGVQLVFELLLSRPTYFSRIVALDAGAAVFDAPQPTPCAWRGSATAGSDTSSAGTPHSPPPPRTPQQFGTPSLPQSFSSPLAPATHAARCRSTTTIDTVPAPPSYGEDNGSHPTTTALHPPTRSATCAFPVTHAERGHPPDMLAELVHEELQLHQHQHQHQQQQWQWRGEGYGPPRRSLASRYAIRPRATNAVKTTNVRNLWQRLSIFAFQLLIIACTFTMPRFIARWVLHVVLWVAGRPRYSVNPHVVVTPENEAFNQTLYQECTLGAGASLCPCGCSSFGAVSPPSLAQRHPNGRDCGAHTDGSAIHRENSEPEERYTLDQTDEYGSRCNVNSRMLSFHEVSHSASQLAPPVFRVPATGDWHIVLVPFLRKPQQPGPDRHANEPFCPVSLGGAGAAATAGSAVLDEKCSGGEAENPPSRYQKGGRALGETSSFMGRLFSRQDGESARTATAARDGGNTIDVGFAMADGVPQWGRTQANSLESVTSVSPYRAYRHARNLIYDSALPSAAMQSCPDVNGSCAAHGGSGTRWLPEDADSNPALASKQYMQWRRKEVYYRSFVIPPPPEGVCVDGGTETGDSCRTRGGGGASGKQRGRSGGRRRPKETPAEVLSTMGWIYLQYWWGVVLSLLFSPSADKSRPAAAKPVGNHRENLGDDHTVTAPVSVAGAYSPLVSQRFFFPVPVPVLYMYGANKPFMLHSAQWCDYVRNVKHAEDGISDVVEVQGGGHWFFAEKKYQRKVAERVAEFIMAKAAA